MNKTETVVERKTSIVATLGPATSSPQAVEALVLAGMNVARLNFSHGTQEEHRDRIGNIREISKRLGKPLACLQDLCGPKIRTGPINDPSGVLLETNHAFTLTTDSIGGSSERISTTYEHLHEEVRPGQRILLDDGLIELLVESVSGRDICTRIISGGVLKPAKGVNLPGTSLSVSALTDKDKDDVEFGLSLDVDYIALSFVRNPEDIHELRALLESKGRTDVPLIAKIEKPEALSNLDSIIEAADGVMVARGDLGVEMSTAEVPMYQKKIIWEAWRRGRLVITATQMLDSMIHNPQPTRAEASDVANAILDGSDAVMLSGETAIGMYPTDAVATMARIAEYTELKQEWIPWRWPSGTSRMDRASVSRAVAKSACNAAEELGARYIITFTDSGETARLVSHYRPAQEILALTSSERTCQMLALPWGITPMKTCHYASIDQLLTEGLDEVNRQGFVESGDLAVVIFGESLLRGASNVVKVHQFP